MNLAFRLAGGDEGKAKLPGSLHVNRRLSQWISINADGTVDIRSGKVEIGQGILTALAQIAAEELDVSLTRIRMQPAATGGSPDEAVTSGSLSVQESGAALRHACAEARAIYLALAAQKLGAAPGELSVTDGTVHHANGKSVTWWELADPDLLDREASPGITAKPVDRHYVVGTAEARRDLPDKVFGAPRYVQDLSLPGMLHARVARPPSPAAMLVAFDDRAALAMPGVVAVARDGRFIAVIAEHEDSAIKGAKKLAAALTWDECGNDTDTLPDENNLGTFLKSQPVETRVIAEHAATDAASVSRRFKANYSRPFIAHASIGPSCAVAQWHGAGEDSTLDVWTHSQGIYNLRADLSIAFAMPKERITVRHVEGAGCYGHNGADDVAYDAALAARSAGGRPVQVQWSREEELGWAPFGPAMQVELEAGVDAEGRIVEWRHEVWSNGHGTRPGRAKIPTLLSAVHLEKPFERFVAINAVLAAGGGSERNAIPGYRFASQKIVNHRLLTMPVRTSALRSLGAHANVFAAESFMDEIARELGIGAVEFRLRHLEDPRGRAVIEAAVARAGIAPSGEGYGRGLGYARYKGTGAWCAVIADVQVTQAVRVTRLVVAVDVGLVINPDGVVNQIEGGAIQAVSWTLKEAVKFNRNRITSTEWEQYPILRFSEVPAVDVEIVSRPDQPAVGAGEAAQGPTAAAIGNALFDALGVRVRDLPLTPERISKAILG